MNLVSENGFFFVAIHHGSGYSAGVTITHDFNIAPAPMFIHCGLSRVQGTNEGPFSATIGVSEFVAIDDNGFVLTPVLLNPEDWQETVYRRLRTFTISANVVRGEMRGWATVQNWV